MITGHITLPVSDNPIVNLEIALTYYSDIESKQQTVMEQHDGFDIASELGRSPETLHHYWITFETKYQKHQHHR